MYKTNNISKSIPSFDACDKDSFIQNRDVPSIAHSSAMNTKFNKINSQFIPLSHTYPFQNNFRVNTLGRSHVW